MRPTIAALLLVASNGVRADHLSTSPNVIRYLKVEIGHGEARIRSTVLIGKLAALPLRQRADRNGDGQLDSEERLALREEMADELNRALIIRLDGGALVPTWDAPSLSSDDTVGVARFALEQSGSVALPPEGRHVLDIEDRATLELLVETEMRVGAPSNLVVDASSNGKVDGSGKAFRWSGRRPIGETRTLTVAFLEAAVSPPARHRALPWQLVFGGLLLVAGATLWWVGRRS
jgi:hypothetical protein